MSIPKWHEFMAPILRISADGALRDRSQIAAEAADDVNLTADERGITLTTGQPMYANRVGWAISHLTKSGALERPERGKYVISPLGRRLLSERPDATRADVERVTGYRRVKAVTEQPQDSSADEDSLDPAELIDRGIKQIRADVAAELLSRILSKSPAFFEQTVVELLVAMGYGTAARIGDSS